MEDKRKFPRFETTFQVKYYPLKKVKHFSYTIAKNVSIGGLCMPVSSRITRRGDIIRLDINKNGGENRVSADGRVRWVKPLKRKALLDAEAGIEFTGIGSAGLETLIPVMT